MTENPEKEAPQENTDILRGFIADTFGATRFTLEELLYQFESWDKPRENPRDTFARLIENGTIGKSEEDGSPETYYLRNSA